MLVLCNFLETFMVSDKMISKACRTRTTLNSLFAKFDNWHSCSTFGTDNKATQTELNPIVLHLCTQWHCLELSVTIHWIPIVSCSGEHPAHSLLLVFQFRFLGILKNNLAFSGFSTKWAKINPLEKSLIFFYYLPKLYIGFKSPSCESHVRQFLQNGVRRGYLVAVAGPMGSTCLLSDRKKELQEIWNSVSIPGGPPGTVDSSGLCSDQQLSFLTLLDRASFPHYNNTKTIKFGWKLFILWVISYGLSFSGFARFPEFRGTINDSFSSTCAHNIDRVLCSVIRVLPIDLHTTLPNKDLQSRHVIGTEISL